MLPRYMMYGRTGGPIIKPLPAAMFSRAFDSIHSILDLLGEPASQKIWQCRLSPLAAHFFQCPGQPNHERPQAPELGPG